MMYYSIRFQPDPKQLIFETIRYFVKADDIIQIVRRNFNIFQRKIMVYDERGIMLNDTDPVENGKTYIVKCTPPKRVMLII